MNKNNKIYLGILVILVIVFAITKLNDNVEERIDFFGVDSADVREIEISNITDTLRLKKQNDIWKIVKPIQYDVAQKQLENFFKTVIGVETSKMPIAESEESLANYKLTVSLATKITFFGKKDKILSSALVGESSDRNNTPARKDDDNKVYRLEENISYLVSSKLERWRDKMIAQIKQTNIKTITVLHPKNNYEISFRDSTWQYKDENGKFPVSSQNASLKKLFSNLNNIRTTKFIDNEYANYKDKLEKPELVLNIVLYDGSALNLKLIKTEEKKYILQKNNQKNTLFSIYESWAKGFIKQAEDFK